MFIGSALIGFNAACRVVKHRAWRTSLARRWRKNCTSFSAQRPTQATSIGCLQFAANAQSAVGHKDCVGRAFSDGVHHTNQMGQPRADDKRHRIRIITGRQFNIIGEPVQWIAVE